MSMTSQSSHQPCERLRRAAAGNAVLRWGLAAIATTMLGSLAAIPGNAQAAGECISVATGLRLPVSSAMTLQGRLLVAEAGDGTPGSGRISIIERNGTRRTLIDGLPSGPADVGDPSGPSGLLLRGPVLMLAMGTGDTGIMGPRPGTTLANPNGPSSPIFSSVLMMSYLPWVENTTTGFTLKPGDDAALAAGRFVWLRDHQGNGMFIHMHANFPDFVAAPLPDVPDNISLSNPFGIAASGASYYVTDGGRNLTWKVHHGAPSEFASFPNMANPLFPQVGGPFIQAVPTGIVAAHGKLQVSLFRGAPFATGVSTIEQVDARTGSHSPLITGLTTAIGTIPLHGHAGPTLVLEMSAAGPFFSGPGTVLRLDNPTASPSTIANCLVRPTSMTLDRTAHRLFVTEQTGDLIKIPLP